MHVKTNLLTYEKFFFFFCVIQFTLYKFDASRAKYQQNDNDDDENDETKIAYHFEHILNGIRYICSIQMR